MKFSATNAALIFSLRPMVGALDLCRTCEKIGKCAKELEVCEKNSGKLQKLIQFTLRVKQKMFFKILSRQICQLCLFPLVQSEAGLDDTSHEVAFWLLFCYGVLSAVLQVFQYFKIRKAKRIMREAEEDEMFFKNYSSGSSKASSHPTPSDFSRNSTKTNDFKSPGAPTSSILRSEKPGLKEATESGFWTSVSGYL